MKIYNPSRGGLGKILSLCMSAALISACGGNSVKEESLTEAESCNRLQGIIKDYPNQFSHYKKNYTIHRSYASWTAEKILPSAGDCQVWEWGKGLDNYFCQWEAEDGENQAVANYQKAVSVIKNCLGENWTAETNKTRTGGERIVFSYGNSPAAVSVRYFQESRGWFNRWYNSLIVGDKSNLNTPIE